MKKQLLFIFMLLTVALTASAYDLEKTAPPEIGEKPESYLIEGPWEEDGFQKLYFLQNGCEVSMYNTDDDEAVVYYRLTTDCQDFEVVSGYPVNTWVEYYGPMQFSIYEGNYMFEVYAQAEGKLPSDTITKTIRVSTDLLDWILHVDNIYYSVNYTGESHNITVSVSAKDPYRVYQYYYSGDENEDYYLSQACYSGDVVIPNQIVNGYYPVTGIRPYAFGGCIGMTSVTIPNSITHIESYAFFGCTGLTSVVIPNSVSFIEPNVFYGCTGLASIIVENDNENYDSRDNCNAVINKWTNSLIVGCKNTIIPNSVTTIGYGALAGCSELTNIDIPNSITSIDDLAFYDCVGLTSVSIGQSVTTIGSSAFYGCTALKSVIIPNSVTTIEARAFYNCSSLSSVIIGNSVTSLGHEVFRGCTGLKSMTCLTNIPPEVTVYAPITYATLYVPYASIEAYKNATFWKDFADIRGIGDVNGDGEMSISDVTDLTDQLLSGTLTYESNPGADVNGDGTISVADITILIDQLLNSSN